MDEIVEIVDKEEVKTLNPRKHKSIPMAEHRKCQVLSLTGGKAQIMDLGNRLTTEIEIPKELKGKGVIEPGRKIVFLYREGKYEIET